MKKNDRMTGNKLKMKKQIFILVITLITIILLISCSNYIESQSPELEKKFLSTVNLANLNSDIQLSLETEKNLFKLGSEITIQINNNSSSFILLGENLDIHLLSPSPNLDWIEIENGITYSGSILLSPKGTILLDTRTTIVRPLLEAHIIEQAGKDELLLRIFVKGEIIESDIRSGDFVGAYIDIYLMP